MIHGLSDALAASEATLRLRAQRQQVIASNIANADTPNYKAVDIDFASALRAAQAKAGGSLALARSDPAHAAAGGGGLAGPAVIDETRPLQPSADGNTVDMDVERARFADNAVRYEVAFRTLNGKLRALQNALAPNT